MSDLINEPVDDLGNPINDYAGFTPEEPETNAPSETESVSGSRPARRGLPFIIHWPTLLLIIILLALSVLGIMAAQGGLPANVALWWPLGIVIPSALWFLIALFRSRAASLIASTTLFGIGLGLLMSLQGIVPSVTGVAGIAFITTGTGIMLRGLLLRNQPVG